MSDFKIVSLLNPGGVSQVSGILAISASTQIQSTGTVHFSNSNGVTFGMLSGAAGGTITASVAAGGGVTGSISAGTTRGTLGEVVFSNSNGISFGMNVQTVTASHNALTSQSNQNVTAANGGFAFQTLSFSNANAFSFGTSAGSAITGSYTVPVVPAIATNVNDVASAGSTGTVTRYAPEDHRHAGVVAFGISNTGTTAGNTATRFGTWVLAASGNVTASASSGGAGQHTAWISVPAQSNQQMTMFATGNTTLSSTGTTNASSLVFRGSGAASVGITNGSVLIDVAAGAAAITQSIGISTQTAGGATAGTSGYATGDDILYHFVPGSNITMSQSLNGASATLSIYGPAAGGTVSSATTVSSVATANAIGADAGRYALEGHQHGGVPTISIVGNTSGTTTQGNMSLILAGGPNITLSASTVAGAMTVSVSAGAGGGGATMSKYIPDYVGNGRFAGAQIGNASLLVYPIAVDAAFIASRFRHLINMSISSSSNSSHGGTLSLGFGLYTKNAGTLSRLHSGTGSFEWTNSSNASTSVLSGLRAYEFSYAGITVTEGDYWLGIWSRTSTAGANWNTMSNWCVTDTGSVFSGFFGSATNNTYTPQLGQGFYASTSTNVPVSVPFSALVHGGAAVFKLPYVGFYNITNT